MLDLNGSIDLDAGAESRSRFDNLLFLIYRLLDKTLGSLDSIAVPTVIDRLC